MKRLPCSKTSLYNDLRNLRKLARYAEQDLKRNDWASFVDCLMELECLASASRCAAQENLEAAE